MLKEYSGLRGTGRNDTSSSEQSVQPYARVSGAFGPLMGWEPTDGCLREESGWRSVSTSAWRREASAGLS